MYKTLEKSKTRKLTLRDIIESILTLNEHVSLEELKNMLGIIDSTANRQLVESIKYNVRAGKLKRLKRGMYKVNMHTISPPTWSISTMGVISNVNSEQIDYHLAREKESDTIEVMSVPIEKVTNNIELMPLPVGGEHDSKLYVVDWHEPSRSSMKCILITDDKEPMFNRILNMAIFLAGKTLSFEIWNQGNKDLKCLFPEYNFTKEEQK